MKLKLIYGILIAILLAGCGKEDTLSPTYADENWFSVEDDPNDELTHLRYLIYTEHGVPIFYNDTLGSVVRYDKSGKAYTHYEILRVGYNVSSSAATKYVLPDNEEDVLDMVELMDEYLFELLPKERRPLSYLLVDTLPVSLSSNTISDRYYRSLTVTCIGEIEQVKYMSDSAKQSFASELAGLTFVDDVQNTEANKDLLVQYDSLIFRIALDNKVYAPSRPGSGYGARQQTSTARQVPNPELWGLLYYRYKQVNAVYFPTKQQDKAAYIGLILSCTDEEIRERYKNSPEVIKKYEMMREMMENAGLLE